MDLGNYVLLKEIDRHKTTLERLDKALKLYRNEREEIRKLQDLHRKLLNKCIEKYLGA